MYTQLFFPHIQGQPGSLSQLL